MFVLHIFRNTNVARSLNIEYAHITEQIKFRTPPWHFPSFSALTWYSIQILLKTKRLETLRIWRTFSADNWASHPSKQRRAHVIVLHCGHHSSVAACSVSCIFYVGITDIGGVGAQHSPDVIGHWQRTRMILWVESHGHETSAKLRPTFENANLITKLFSNW